MDDAFLRGLDAEVQMVPLCGASKARPAVNMALVVVVVVVVVGVWEGIAPCFVNPDTRLILC